MNVHNMTEKELLEHAIDGDVKGSGSMLSLIYDREVLVRALRAGRVHLASSVETAHAEALYGLEQKASAEAAAPLAVEEKQP